MFSTLGQRLPVVERSAEASAVRPGQPAARHEAAFEAARASDDLRIEASGRVWRYDTPGILHIRTALQHSYIDLASGARADFNIADTTLTIDNIRFDADAAHTLRTIATTTTYALTTSSDTASSGKISGRRLFACW